MSALPAPLAVWMVVGVLGGSMSTASTALMGASSTILRDFYQRFLRPTATSRQLLLPSRLAVLAAGVLTCLLAIFYPGGAAWLLALAGAWFGTPAVLLVLSISWKRLTPAGGFWGIVSGLTATIGWQLGPWWQSVSHMVCIALAVTLVVTVLVSLATQPQTAPREEPLILTDRHRRILTLLREGRTTLDALADSLEIDGEQAFRTITELIDAGFLRRLGEAGASRLVFLLTDAGSAELPPLTTEEASMLRAGITLGDYRVLAALGKEQLPGTGAGSSPTGMDRQELRKHIVHLIRRGYLQERGLFRRHVKLSPRGSDLIAPP